MYKQTVKTSCMNYINLKNKSHRAANKYFEISCTSDRNHALTRHITFVWYWCYWKGDNENSIKKSIKTVFNIHTNL